MSGVVNAVGSKSNIVNTGGLANMVGYRASGTSTLAGWSEYTSVRGRMIVGLQSGGADAGTVGTAFTTAQDLSKSIAHTHTISNHQHKMGWKGDNAEVTNSFGYQHGSSFGNSDTFALERYIVATPDHSPASVDGRMSSDPTTNPVSGAMSANAAVVTSDILAYIQLMVIKKD